MKITRLEQFITAVPHISLNLTTMGGAEEGARLGYKTQHWSVPRAGYPYASMPPYPTASSLPVPQNGTGPVSEVADRPYHVDRSLRMLCRSRRYRATLPFTAPQVAESGLWLSQAGAWPRWEPRRYLETSRWPGSPPGQSG